VISYSVSQRTGEFGIRMALGARRKDVLLMVFRSAAMSVAGGVLTGVALTIVLNRVLARWIQGNSLDALVLVGVIVLLVAITSSLSARISARRVDHGRTALRAEIRGGEAGNHDQ